MTWDTKPALFGMARSCASKLAFEHEWQAAGCCKKLAKAKKRFTKPYKCDTCMRFHNATCTETEYCVAVLGYKMKPALIGPHRPDGSHWRKRKYGECLLDNHTGTVLAIIYNPAQGTSLVEYWTTGDGKDWAESFDDARRMVRIIMRKKRKEAAK